MRDRLLYRDRDVTRERDRDWRSARAAANHRRGEIQTVYGAGPARPPRRAAAARRRHTSQLSRRRPTGGGLTPLFRVIATCNRRRRDATQAAAVAAVASRFVVVTRFFFSFTRRFSLYGVLHVTAMYCDD